jgi:hypothetical protein
VFINVALIIALISSTLTIKEMLILMKRRSTKVHSIQTITPQHTANKWTRSSFVVQTKLTMTSIVLILVLIIYDVIAIIEVYDDELGHYLLPYISDIFALINPILLLSFSKQVRSLFKVVLF